MIGLPHESVEELPLPSVDVDIDPDPSTKKDDKVRCRNCSYTITRGRWAIQRGGAFQHRFRNPAGWSFQVGCYAKAPGVLICDEPNADHSWFPGYLWQFTLCEKCGTHLGWWYIGADEFAGLILTRLC